MLSDDLKAARALIDTPEKWLKGDAKHGNCRCAWAAVIGVVRRQGLTPEAEDARERSMCSALVKSLPRKSGSVASRLITFNDRKGTTHPDLLALFDRAILNAEQAEKPNG